MLLLAHTLAIFFMPLALPPPQPRLPADLLPLKAELIRYGFTVRLERPPQYDMYGVFNSKTRTMWIAPITIPLGIVRQSFLHEAVHAAQSCSLGRPTLLGIKATVAPVVNQEINGILTTRYDNANRALEREAFLLQSQPDAVAILIRALRSRCNLKTI
jgi:hypothetical protein